MLRRLQIENYGLIARAELEFSEAATIFTGETGSGKTMLLGALDFALGARAGPDAVRRGARKAIVTLEFDPDDELRARLCADGFELDRGEAGSVSREMGETGRSSVRVNGRPATAAYVRDIGEALTEIIGQHEAQRLLSPSYHLQLLDRFAGAEALRLRNEVAAAHARAEAAALSLAQIAHNEQHARARYEEARYAVGEIGEAHLEPGELERLGERRGYLDNIERIAAALQIAREALTSDESGATASIGSAAVALSRVAKFDASLQGMAQRAAALQSDAGDLAGDVARSLDAMEFDPVELESINTRLALIDRLKRKYGGDIDEIIAYATRARRDLDAYENRDRVTSEQQATLAAAQRDLETAGSALTASRKKAAQALTKRVAAEFADIALASGTFEVAFEPLERIAAHGAENVEFLFAANAGEPARPLARVASGGELARVLLALVVVLAGTRDAQGALVFDEIDTGIGGATATAVGARIGELAKREQVVCVTHLAQLATWADRHYVLDKIESKGETTIAVREIRTMKEREAEIARMLSGESHDAALRHARALLKR